ncbi:hypothetical protein QC764_0045980 [Podospora pseudoanserina]|uniref:Protein kinase domain-containing protein n=1 Tax=Podospora pseudoanserina TaxID=2609844 RepID=A0ABR0IJE9_9PEZI|nr:hypothetical protein QC764_0045980 [Podospora pseudoanserina]
MASPNDSTIRDDSGFVGVQRSTDIPFGEKIEERGWKNMTLVAFPLERPEVAEREAYKNESPVTNKSLIWLQARPKGFVLIRWFTLPKYVTKNGVMVGLFHSVDKPEEQVVIKQVLGNISWRLSSNVNGIIPEIEYMTLDDPAAYRSLEYDPILYPISQMYAVQIHDYGTRPDNDIKNWHGDSQSTMFMKYYNGGSLWELLENYKKGCLSKNSERTGAEDVPEEFIWHFIAQVGRAYAYLHTGHVKSPEENLRNNNHLKPDLKHPTLIDWVSIGHNDGHLHNIWLHYPSAEEKQKDPRLENFNACFPQIHLADFGLACDVKHDVHGEYKARLKKLPEPGTWFDKMYFGVMLKTLLTISEKRIKAWGLGRELAFHVAEREQAGDEIKFPFTKLATSKKLRAKYSGELLDLVGKFEDMFDFAAEEYDNTADMKEATCAWWTEFTQTKKVQRERRWEEWPSNDWLYGHVIALADYKLDQHRRAKDKRDRPVMWTMGIRGGMPYRAYDPQRWPFTATQDFQQAHMALAAIRVHTFPFWPSRSAVIMVMEARGGKYKDLVRTIHRHNKILNDRRKLLKIAEKNYTYPFMNNFYVKPLITAPQAGTSTPSHAHQSSSPQQSGRSQQSSSSHQSSIPTMSTNSPLREAAIVARVNKPVWELYPFMARELSTLDIRRSRQIDIATRGNLSDIDKRILAIVDKHVKNILAARSSFWAEVERRKVKHLQEEKHHVNSTFEGRKADYSLAHVYKERNIISQISMHHEFDRKHNDTIRRINNEVRFLESLMEWWKDQISFINNQQFTDGGTVPVHRDSKSKPDLYDEWMLEAEHEQSSSADPDGKFTILPDPNDPSHENRALGRLEKYCEYVLRTGFFENPDMTLKDVTNLPAFWAADDTILLEAEQAAENSFVDGLSMPADEESVTTLRNLFNAPGDLNDGRMDQTIQDNIDVAEGDPSYIDSSVRRSTPTTKGIPLAEYYRKLYAGESPWAGEEDAGDGDDAPTMAKMSSVMTLQVLSEDKDGGTDTLSRNLNIPTSQGRLVAQTLPGRYQGTTVPSQRPKTSQTRTITHSVDSALGPAPEKFRQGPRPWTSLDDFMRSGMESRLFGPLPVQTFDPKRCIRAWHLRLEGDSTPEEYVRNGMDKAIQHAIRVEEELQNGAWDDGAHGPPKLDQGAFSATNTSSDGAASEDLYTFHLPWLSVYNDLDGIIRLRINFLHDDTTTENPTLVERLRNTFPFFGNDMVRTGAIGEFAVGIADYAGGPVFEAAALKIAKAGWRLEVHALGENDLKTQLEGFEKVDAEVSIKNLRWVVAHVPRISTDSLRRLKVLGAGVNVSGWLYLSGTGNTTNPAGPPFRRILDSGIHGGFGPDGANIAPLSPWPHAYYAITGKNAKGEVINPGQSISRQEVLELFTKHNTWFLGGPDEHSLGVLETGRLGDVAVLSEDYFTIPEERIKQLRSVLTVVGGVVVWDSGEI